MSTSTQSIELLTKSKVEKFSPADVADALKELVDHKQFDAELAREQLANRQAELERQAVTFLREQGVDPEVVEHEGNLLVFGGGSALWHRLIGGSTVAAFSNANAHLGVGDSATAAAATQTDLQAASNKLRKAMEATYPQHTDATTSGAHQSVWRSLFGTTEANFPWQEWGLFNASSAGRMLNRKVESFGTKANGSIWTLTITLSLVGS